MMAAPRKVFRIEQMAGAWREPPPTDGSPVPPYDEIMHELAALRGKLAAALPSQPPAAAAVQRGQVERLTSKLQLIRSAILGAKEDDAGGDKPRSTATSTTRIANELQAVMQASEQATQRILAAAEEIDQAANNLSAALKGDSEQGLAQDIRDRVIAIFEACNFQDLNSQRVAKVMAALARIDNQISLTLEELARDAAPAVHGPRLEGDGGHASQRDVDSIFGSWDVNSA
jgi:chemotaxis protein CheZ